MNIIFETSRALCNVQGDIQFEVIKPQIDGEPVLQPDAAIGERNLTLYGSVVKDPRGLFRMWYQSISAAQDAGEEPVGVLQAHSEDGIHWQRGGVSAGYGEIPWRTNLDLHSPSVWIETDASGELIYRASGYGKTIPINHAADLESPGRTSENGYCTAHSRDGSHWIMDPGPRWKGADVITGTWHPGRNAAIIALKRLVFFGRRRRRSIFTSELRGSSHSDPALALVADDFDDHLARVSDGSSADYYGMAQLPVGRDSVLGFVWIFRHEPPYISGDFGLFGNSSIQLAFQEKAGDRWVFPCGRQPVITPGDVGAAYQWVHSASAPIECGDQHWLYLTAVPHPHGYGFNPDGSRDKAKQAAAPTNSIHIARWGRWRFCGARAETEGMLVIDMGHFDRPQRIKLNYSCQEGGSVSAAILRDEGFNNPQRTHEQAIILHGDSTSATLTWQSGDQVHPEPNQSVQLHLIIKNATVFAWQIEPI